MPRTKAATSIQEPEKKILKKKPAKEIKKTTEIKKAAPRRKAKPVIVDVIEDEEKVPEEETDFFASLPQPEEIEETKAAVHRPNGEDLDKQKKFFTELSLKAETKKVNKDNFFDEEDEIKAPRKSLNLYRSLVWKFIALVVFLAAVVTYFFYSSLTIVITPKGETLSDSVFLKVAKPGAAVEADDPRETVEGVVKEISGHVEKTYPATGEEFVGEEIVGKVKIINNYIKSQALVAKTRILSPDNKLFRIKEGVNIPAGGEVEVEIYADKPAKDLAIGPASFVIPGLWVGLQDKIYARSETAFTFDQKVKRYVKQTDIEEATRDITDSLAQSAKSEAGEASKNGAWLYDTSEAAKVTVGAKAGEAKDSFTASATGLIVAVSFSRDQAQKLAAAKLNLLVPDDKELIDFHPEDINYALENYDAAAGIATIRETFIGVMSLKKDSQVIDRQQLVNLNQEQIDNYLKGFPEIKSYELKFSPAFIHKAPRLVDRITIKINKN